MIDLFNKTKVKQLNDALELQAVELRELKSMISILQTKLSYQEGELKSKLEVIETLKNQLVNEMQQRDSFQKTFLQFYSPSKEKVREEANGFFLEDEDAVNDIVKTFIDQEEGDL